MLAFDTPVTLDPPKVTSQVTSDLALPLVEIHELFFKIFKFLRRSGDPWTVRSSQRKKKIKFNILKFLDS